MRFTKRSIVQKRPYAKISLKKRQQLVESVLTDNVSITKAAKRIKIKLATARLIVKKFKETGTFPMKKFRETAIIPAEIRRNEQLQLRQVLESNNFQEAEVLSIAPQITYPSQYCQEFHERLHNGVFVYYCWPYLPFQTGFV